MATERFAEILPGLLIFLLQPGPTRLVHTRN